MNWILEVAGGMNYTIGHYTGKKCCNSTHLLVCLEVTHVAQMWDLYNGFVWPEKEKTNETHKTHKNNKIQYKNV